MRLLALAVVVLLAAGAAAVLTRDGGDADDHVGLAAGPVRDRLAWVVTLLNDGTGESEIDDVFAPSFLAVIPAEQVATLAEQQIRPAGPFRIAEVERETETAAVVVLRGPTGVAVRVSIAVEPVSPHRITGLLLRPATSPAATPSSFDDLEATIREAAPDVAFLVAEVVDGECRVAAAFEPDRVLPIGSAFKLYVLGAVVDEVSAGRAAWDETIALRDDRRVQGSIAHGSTPAGAEVSLRELARAMISVSDNTATDHVIERIGRDRVAAQQAVLGLADPTRNDPFLTTREMSLLKFGVAREVRDEFLAAAAARRHEIVADLPAHGATVDDLQGLTRHPVALDIEWFASPMDLCRAHVALHAKGADAREILSANPGTGIELDRSEWPSIAFKGGSEPGVLALSWLATRRDGSQWFVGALLRNDDGPVPTEIALSVAAAFDLV